MKHTIAYISPDCYLQVDIPFIEGLSKQFDIVWIPILYDSSPVDKDFLVSWSKAHSVDCQPANTCIRERSIKNINFYSQIVKTVKAAKAEMVFTSLTNPYWTLVSKLNLHVPVVTAVHDYQQHSSAKLSVLFDMALKLAVLTNNNFLFYSSRQAELFRADFPSKNIIQADLPLSDYGVPSVCPTSINDGLKLLFFGRIEKYKGLDLLIDALEKAYSEGCTGVKLTIAGRGPAWEEASSHIIHEDLYDLRIGFVEDAQVADLFALCHFLVLPYRDTTQSGPMMISLNYDMPVVMADHAAFRSIYDEKAAFIYDSQEALVDIIKRISSLSQEEYDAMKLATSRRKEQFTPESIASKVAVCLAKIIEG